MIVTGIFMFLLGTKLGQAATKTEVKYEGPNKITVSEEKDENIILPGLGPPPFAPSFFHQGSNFFFNPQIMLPGGIIPTIERMTAPFDYNNNIPLVTPEITPNIVIEKEPVVEMLVPEFSPVVIPQFEIEETFSLPQAKSNITVVCEDIEIKNIIPGVPMLIEDPFQPSGGLFISEVDVRVNKIPPPPELPPLIISEIPKPVYVPENRRIILIPSAPELTAFYPPSVMLAEKSLIATDCAQSIVFERVLQNIAFENSKMVELISIPATKRPPVVSTIIY